MLGELLDLSDECDDGLELLVGLAEGRLELGVGVDQTLDLVQSVDDKHVDQVFAGAVQPVVEGLRENRNTTKIMKRIISLSSKAGFIFGRLARNPRFDNVT